MNFYWEVFSLNIEQASLILCVNKKNENFVRQITIYHYTYLVLLLSIPDFSYNTKFFNFFYVEHLCGEMQQVYNITTEFSRTLWRQILNINLTTQAWNESSLPIKKEELELDIIFFHHCTMFLISSINCYVKNMDKHRNFGVENLEYLASH